jgi:hypothetical protein
MQRSDITRISELPEAHSNRGVGNSDAYQPLNIHKNPYGLPDPPADRQLPMGGAGGFLGEGFMPPPPPIHSRGQDNSNYMHDEQTVPNYIPKPKLTADYLNEYEKKLETMQKDAIYQRAKHQEALVSSLYDEIQIPILIGVMFFLFHLPFVNSTFYNYAKWAFSEDGNMNLTGIVFKSCVFGLFYFGFIRLTS